jgi:hypothetical protein
VLRILKIKKHTMTKKTYKRFMFKMASEIIKPANFEEYFGVNYNSIFNINGGELRKLDYGTHIKTYNNITFVVIVY